MKCLTPRTVLPTVIVRNPEFRGQNPENSGNFFEKYGKIPERFLAVDLCCPEQVSLYHFHNEIIHYHFHTKTCFNFNITKENQFQI